MASFQKRCKKWRAIVRKKGHKDVSKSFSTKAMAERWAREVERDMEAGTFNDPKQLERVTLGELIRRAREEMPEAGRSKAAALAMLEREIGDVTLADLDKQRIIQYAKYRATEHGAGPATIEQDMIYLYGILKTARAHWDIPVNLEAASDARLLLRREAIIGKSQERERRPTEDELEALRQYWARPALRNMKCPMWDITQFAVATAMRLSEICRICWDDIDEDDRTIVIRDRKHPQRKLGNHQTVPLLRDAWDIVQRQPRDDERIFPYNPRSVSANVTRATLRCGFQDLRFHDLRHHAISLLFEAGYQIPQVALVSGHSDWKQLKRYTQIKAKDLHR